MDRARGGVRGKAVASPAASVVRGRRDDARIWALPARRRLGVSLGRGANVSLLDRRGGLQFQDRPRL